MYRAEQQFEDPLFSRKSRICDGPSPIQKVLQLIAAPGLPPARRGRSQKQQERRFLQTLFQVLVDKPVPFFVVIEKDLARSAQPPEKLIFHPPWNLPPQAPTPPIWNSPAGPAVTDE